MFREEFRYQRKVVFSMRIYVHCVCTQEVCTYNIPLNYNLKHYLLEDDVIFTNPTNFVFKQMHSVTFVRLPVINKNAFCYIYTSVK